MAISVIAILFSQGFRSLAAAFRRQAVALPLSALYNP
jgi:hypothetical protein